MTTSKPIVVASVLNESAKSQNTPPLALRRWKSSGVADAAAALSMSRQHAADLRPEILLWFCGHTDYRGDAVEYARTRIAIRADRLRVAVTDAVLDAAAVDAVAAIERCRSSTAAERAKQLKIRYATFLELRESAKTFLWFAVHSGMTRYYAATGARERFAPADRHNENMKPTNTEIQPSVMPQVHVRLDAAALRERIDSVFAKVCAEVNEIVGTIAGQPGQVDWLLGLDETSTYPPRTFAIHRGGLIASERQTDPIVGGSLQAAGWSVLLSDFYDLRMDQDPVEPEILIYRLMMTDGTTVDIPIPFPAQVFKGQYEAGREYRLMAVVSHIAQLWCANTNTSAEPGTSEDWEPFEEATAEDREILCRAYNEAIKSVLAPLTHKSAAAFGRLVQ